MLIQKVEIINELGLHARAAAKFVACASRFESTMQVRKDDKMVDGKSIMSIMLLAASIGSILEIEVCGADEGEAMTAIIDLIANKFGEEN
jgi:phosphocarrier protein